jgi:hypothetical protein
MSDIAYVFSEVAATHVQVQQAAASLMVFRRPGSRKLPGWQSLHYHNDCAG